MELESLELRGGRGEVLPLSFGHQSHLSPMAVLVEPPWSPGKKDATVTKREVSPH